MKEQKWIRESLIAESLFQFYFQVHLANEDLVLGYVSGKIQRSIRILRAKMEVNIYNLIRGQRASIL